MGSSGFADSRGRSATGPRAEFNPAWAADGTLTIASLKPGGGSDAVSVDASGETASVAGSGDAIDLPLAWSPDGDKLAVRSVAGATPAEAGESHVELIDSGGGGRERVSESADVLIVGWLR